MVACEPWDLTVNCVIDMRRILKINYFWHNGIEKSHRSKMCK